MDTDLFKYSKTADKWKKIGLQRRAGVALPLFSVYSSKSTGIGEIADIRYLVDWCNAAGLSILQLLPLNETGGDFAPYSSISTFAIDPVYICLRRLRKTDLTTFRKELREIKKNFPKKNTKVDYNIRHEKVKLLRKIFNSKYRSDSVKLDKFISENVHWLKYYALFKIISDIYPFKQWTDWKLKHRYLSSVNAEKLLSENPDEVKFHYWVQWQLFEQLTTVKKYAVRKNVFIMGDIPFLVSRNSADVWAYKNYFKLHLSSGAPPDMYFADGQKWGMPPYNWLNIETDNYVYIKQRLIYAQNFYDMFRIDHFVGLFRVWTIPTNISQKESGKSGRFDPEDESEWESHGRAVINVMNDCTEMLPCAEDLGTIPSCSEKILREFGIVGINVQRWEKNYSDNFILTSPDKYRINSVSVLSTHDSSPLVPWYKNEIGCVDENTFINFFEKKKYSVEKIYQIRIKLFEQKLNAYNKLVWKKSINGVFKLLDIIELNYEQAKEFVDIYLMTYSEKSKYCRYIGYDGEKENSVTTKFIDMSLQTIFKCNSIFSIQLIQEYLNLDKDFLKNHSGPDYRINSPGTVSDLNWTMRIPIPMDELLNSPVNDVLKKLTENSGRHSN